MAEVLLFHHAQGLTLVCARSPTTCGPPATSCIRRTCSTDARSRASTRVSPTSVRSDSTTCGRGVRVADELPPELVYAGFSFGVLPGQKLAQTRPGARGPALLLLPSDQRRVGLRTLAGRRRGPDPRHGQRPDLRWRGRHRRRPRSWRRSGMRAFPVPWRPAPLRRQLTPVVRRGFDRSTHQTSASFWIASDPFGAMARIRAYA